MQGMLRLKKLLVVIAFIGIVAVGVAKAVLTAPMSPSDESQFTGDDRDAHGGDAGTWDGDDGDGDDDDGDDGNPGEFLLFGTAERVEFLDNEVLRIDTAPAGTFGGASVGLETPFGTLNRRISLNAYLATIDCHGGSPRISLRVDLNGDGASDGNAFGYLGPFPSFSGCAQQVWQYHDLTDGVRRWDTAQLAGATPTTICGSFVCTFAQVASFLSSNFPNHAVLRGSLVQDAFTAVMQGYAFYDDIQIGEAVLG